MIKQRITLEEVAAYKRDIMEKSVLVDLSTVAEVLSVTPRTVRSYVRSGKIQAYSQSPGSRGLRVLASDLRDYVKSIRLDIEEIEL